MKAILPESEVAPANGKTYGPYLPVREIVLPGVLRAWLAVDPILQREVWIVERASEDPLVSDARRDLARPGRLRWLNGARAGSEAWDAYEAASGGLVDTGSTGAMAWEQARSIMLQLSTELECSLHSDTLPSSLSLGNIFVTPQGRAVILDFDLDCNLPTTSDNQSQISEQEHVIVARQFLHDVAATLLCKNFVVDGNGEHPQFPIDMPLSARRIMADLRGPSEGSLPVAELKRANEQPARITRESRKAVFLMSLLLILLTSLTLEAIPDAPDPTESLLLEEPRIGALAGLVDYYQYLIEREQEDPTLDYFGPYKDAIEIACHDGFGDLLSDPAIKQRPGISWLMEEDDFKLLATFKSRPRPTQSSEEHYSNFVAIRDGLESVRWTAEEYHNHVSKPWDWVEQMWLPVSVVLAFFVALPSIVGALLIGNSPLLVVLGVSVISTNGEVASRPRVLVRNLLLWTITLTGPVMTLFMDRAEWSSLVVVFTAICSCAILAWAFLADRGPHDRLTGTLLVPN